MASDRYTSHRAASVPGNYKPAVTVPPFSPGREKDEKTPLPWSDLGFPAAAVMTAGLLNLLCIPPLIRHLNPPPAPSHPSVSADDVVHLFSSIRRLGVSQGQQVEFQKLYSTRPFATNTAGADSVSAEQWLRSAAHFYDGIQTEIWVLRLHLNDYPANLKNRLSRNEDMLDDSVRDRFLAALYRVQNDPHFAPDRDTNAVFQPYESLPGAWPNLSLRLLYAELQEVRNLNEKAAEAADTTSFWSRSLLLNQK